MSQTSPEQYKGKLKDSIYWYLSKRKPFIINGEYMVELLHLDRDHNSAKIRVTNLETQEIMELKDVQQIAEG
jgi:hypothetical protein